jgi:hypothetical protein
MTLTITEFESVLGDQSKRIAGDIVWAVDEDHSPSLEFRAEVVSEAGWPLFVRGSVNHVAGTLTFALILKTAGRVYALDLGKDHHNPTCEQVGEKHKHRWTEQFRDKQAYVPTDIAAPVTDPVGVWNEFCAEANITHLGAMARPQPPQRELFT